ncbi:MAG: hypothetical protein WC683_04115 [bacterium]
MRGAAPSVYLGYIEGIDVVVEYEWDRFNRIATIKAIRLDPDGKDFLAVVSESAKERLAQRIEEWERDAEEPVEREEVVHDE